VEVSQAQSDEVVRCSSYDVVDYAACDVCQSEVATAISVSQFRMIDPKQIEDRGVKVMDMDRLVDDLPTEVVSGAIRDSSLHSASR